MLMMAIPDVEIMTVCLFGKMVLMSSDGTNVHSSNFKKWQV